MRITDHNSRIFVIEAMGSRSTKWERNMATMRTMENIQELAFGNWRR
jgi:hypothetical protein